LSDAVIVPVGFVGTERIDIAAELNAPDQHDPSYSLKYIVPELVTVYEDVEGDAVLVPDSVVCQ
jgi:hypothetical protein